VFTLTDSSDADSGITQSSYTCTASANQNCNVTIYDNAGNSQDCSSPVNRVDTVNPVCGTTFSPAAPVPWKTTSATQVFTLTDSSDADSGITQTSYTCTASANQSCTVTIYDNAGRSAGCTSPVNRVDTEAPEIPSFSASGSLTSQGSNTYVSDSGTYSLSAARSDSGSGIDSDNTYFMVATAEIVGDTCQTFSDYENGTPDATSLSQTDKEQGCYRYKYHAADVAGNTSESIVITIKVITLDPTASTYCQTHSSSGNMQTWTGCASLSTPAALGYTQGPCLTDSRDGKVYEIRKFADGKCWMVDNLRYGGNPDGCAGVEFDPYGPRISISGQPWGYGMCGVSYSENNSCFNNTICGYMYNWQAVMQHASAYDGNDYQPTEPTTGICPVGWHVPSGGDGEFSKLDLANGGNGIEYDVWSDDELSIYYNFFFPDGGWKSIDTVPMTFFGASSYSCDHGYWWSSTQCDPDHDQDRCAHFMCVNSGLSSFTHILGLQNLTYKYAGFAVRCVKN
jgi:uncharacterized protein (TIGR02145 family)